MCGQDGIVSHWLSAGGWESLSALKTSIWPRRAAWVDVTWVGHGF